MLFISLSNALAPVAIAFGVIEIGGSASQLGLVLAARTASQTLLLLVGGVIADRWPRHLILMVCGAAGVVTHVAAALVILVGSGPLWQLAVLEAVNGAAAAFSYPAIAGMLPLLVSKAQMARASSTTGLARFTGFVLGGLVAGLVAGYVSSGVALLAAAVAVLAGTLLLIPLGSVPTAATDAPSGHLGHQLAQGWRTFIGLPWLWVVVAGFCVLNMVSSGIWRTLGPIIATNSVGEAGWGLTLALFSAGMAIGNLALMRIQPRHLLRAGVAAAALEVPALVALGFPRLAVIAPLALLAGGGIGYFSASWRATLGREIPPDRLSRVSSIDGLGSFIAIPVGQVAASQLYDRIGGEAVILLGATLSAVTVAAMLATPAVRRLVSTT
ncbi:MFS transporter [Rhizocola hellebori]|uniref:MFS transporter n=1 Tax=Rhizocola hellebori TaxID=1392758 RepID=A0A8J3VLD7_9ACTN|nr:MFS transporter [Rhizocola hellebori]